MMILNVLLEESGFFELAATGVLSRTRSGRAVAGRVGRALGGAVGAVLE